MNDNDIDHLCKMLKQSHEIACKASGFTDTIFMQALEVVIHLRQQRDEARREVCGMNESGLRMNDSDKQREAKRRGWDCFKEITNV